MRFTTTTSFALLLVVCCVLHLHRDSATTTMVDAYMNHISPSSSMPRRRSFLTMKRGGRRMDKDLMSSSGGGKRGVGSSSSSSAGGGGVAVNWKPINVPAKQVSKQKEGEVKLIDTNLKTMKDSLTNPTGAVSVLRYKDQTYCFASACPCCKIPLTKASVVETDAGGEPRLVCGFCKSNYDLKTGAKIAKSDEVKGSGGLFGGLAKNLFSASPESSGPLKMYKLGEKNGKLLIDNE